MNLKNILCAFLLCSLLLGLTACNSLESSNSDPTEYSKPKPTEYSKTEPTENDIKNNVSTDYIEETDSKYNADTQFNFKGAKFKYDDSSLKLTIGDNDSVTLSRLTSPAVIVMISQIKMIEGMEISDLLANFIKEYDEVIKFEEYSINGDSACDIIYTIENEYLTNYNFNFGIVHNDKAYLFLCLGDTRDIEFCNQIIEKIKQTIEF